MLATTPARIEDLTGRTLAELDAVVRAKTPELRAVQKELGEALAAIERMSTREGLTALRVTSFPIYLESRGLSPSEGFAMRSAAEACQQSPEVAKAVEEQKLSVPKAALLRDVLKKPQLQRAGEDLVAAAQGLTTTELRNEVNQRKADARLSEAAVRRTLFFSRGGIDALTRTRQLVASARKRTVTESEAAETALREFVTRNDPEQKALRAQKRREKRAASDAQVNGKPRRSSQSRARVSAGAGVAAESVNARPDCAGPTNGRSPGETSSAASGRTPHVDTSSAPDEARGRYIRAGDRHLVIERFGDRCWVAGCDDRSRQTLAHGKPYRFGGSNSFRNLARYCLSHHRQFDGGVWKVVVRGNDAILVDRRGLVVGRLRGLPPRALPAARAPP